MKSNHCKYFFATRNGLFAKNFIIAKIDFCCSGSIIRLFGDRLERVKKVIANKNVIILHIQLLYTFSLVYSNKEIYVYAKYYSYMIYRVYKT